VSQLGSRALASHPPDQVRQRAILMARRHAAMRHTATGKTMHKDFRE
jgi:hypothetical protein